MNLFVRSMVDTCCDESKTRRNYTSSSSSSRKVQRIFCDDDDDDDDIDIIACHLKVPTCHSRSSTHLFRWTHLACVPACCLQRSLFCLRFDR